MKVGAGSSNVGGSGAVTTKDGQMKIDQNLYAQGGKLSGTAQIFGPDGKLKNEFQFSTEIEEDTNGSDT